MLEGCIRGIEENWFQGRIADSAYELERSFNSGERIVVGVNDFLEGNDDEDLVHAADHQRGRAQAAQRDSNRCAPSATTSGCASRSSDVGTMRPTRRST